MIESPDFELPTPTNGAPPPEKPVADWLPIPLEDPEDPVPPLAPEVSVLPVPVGEVEVVVEVEEPAAAPLDEDPKPPIDDPSPPVEGDPNAELDPEYPEAPEDPEDPAAPAPVPPPEAIPAA